MRVAKIIACTGDFGSGKSNFASWMAVCLTKRYGSPLWANYDLRGSIPLRSVSDLLNCRGGVIVLDELHDIVDSRTSAGMANAEFLEWFMQSRKQQCDLFICTQVLDQIDKRVRRMVKMEFTFTAITDWLSSYSNYIIDLDGNRARRLSVRVWDRHLGAPLYDHLGKAWKLEPAARRGSGAAGAGSKAATPAPAPAPVLDISPAPARELVAVSGGPRSTPRR